MNGKRGVLKANTSLIAEKIKEASFSVLPIAIIVFILAISATPIESGTFLSFLFGTFLIILGMGLFSLGANSAIMTMGEYVSSTVVKTKKIWIIIPIFFAVGVLITVAEPDLQVLASQLENVINTYVLLIVVGLGVGIFLVVAFLRIIFKIKLKYLLIALYTAVFVFAFFVPESFVPLSFDSGGVTTGPMSVPFIIAIGTGIASMRSDKNAEDDSFGLTALCSVGPILAVMILGVIYKPQSITITENVATQITDSKRLFFSYAENLPVYLKEVGIALLPIVVLFFLFKIINMRAGGQPILRIIFGILYTYFGLVLFMLGVNVGFLPVGSLIGREIGSLNYSWIMIPIGFIFGFFIVAAEPAVHVLTKQVFEVTNGAFPKKTLAVSLMVGVGIAVALAMTRILLKIPITYFLIPTYAVALTLTFFVPDIFTAIAFDSGGVASGAMTSSFLLPLSLGLCTVTGGDVAREGFGVVAFVAMTPLVTIQLLGLVYKIKSRKKKNKTETASQDEIIID